MRNLNKKLSLGLIITIPVVATLAAVIGVWGLKKEDNINYWFENEFKNIKPKESYFIKGADFSSYAEIIEQSSKKNDLNLINEDDQKIYLDKNGNKKNLFELSQYYGINSLRLRVWNNPYTEDKKSYGGGHNDIDTNIWITNQAKKFGIKDVLLDFHFSDFWADPARQWLPKAWEELNTEELKKTIEDYTYSSLSKFYDNTKIIPSTVQLGNEITTGSFWNQKGKSKSGKYNLIQTAEYLRSAANGVERFEKFYEKKVNKAIHIDGTPSIVYWENILNKYLNEGGAKSWVDKIGVTYYPDWNGSNVKLFKVMRLIKEKFGLDSYISETAAPHTFEPTNLVGDIASSQVGNQEQLNANPSPESQTKHINSIMETISKALPETKTGFYWWEPAWILVGKSGWATRQGVIYSEPNDEEKQKSFNTGNSWWNRGFFDKNRRVLPVLDAIKNFKRIPSINEYAVDANKLFMGDYLKWFANDPIFKNSLLISENWKEKTNLENELKIKEFVLNTEENLEQSLIKKILIENPSLMKSQLKFTHLEYDSLLKSGFIEVTLSENNFYYFLSKPIKINFKIVEKYLDVLDFSANSASSNQGVIDIRENDKEWLKEIYKYIEKESSLSQKILDKLKNTILDKYGYSKNFYFSNHSLAFWDDEYEVTRWLKDWISISSNGSNIMSEGNIVDYETLKKETSWRDTIKKGKQELLIYLTKSVDFELFGHENWKELSTVAFKVTVNVS